MANLRLNTTDIVGSLIPDVYVDNVILESKGSFIKERNPHIDFEGEAGGRVDPVSGRIIQPRDSPEEQKKLTVTVDLLLKDLVEDNPVSSWFEQQDFHKFLKVKVFASTSDIVSNLLIRTQRDKSIAKLVYGAGIAHRRRPNTRAILAHQLHQRRAEGGFRNLDVANAHLEKHFYEAEMTLNIPFHQGLFEIQEDRDGNVIRNYNIRTIFSQIKTESPEHLTVFAFTYLDLIALQDEFSDLDFGQTAQLEFLTGRVIIQSVIKDSQIVKEAAIFRDSTGRVYTGPVHKMGDGVFMSGHAHGATENQIYLNRTIIPNITVQDFRNFDVLEKRVVDFSFWEKNTLPAFNKVFREHVKRNIKNLDKTVYFSDLFLTRGLDDQANMVFSFDYERFIKDNTKYPLLLEKERDLARTHYSISSLKIIRRRVEKPRKFKEDVIGLSVNEGDILPFDKNQPNYVVIEGQEAYAGGFRSFIAEQTNSSIREVNLGIGSSLRTFTAADKAVSLLTDGYYQYGVEIEIQDKSSKFLQERLNQLLAARRNLYEYYMEAAQPTSRFSNAMIPDHDPHVIPNPRVPSRESLSRIESPANYNPATNRFTQQFIEKIVARYQNGDAPWNSAVFILMKLLFTFTAAGGSRGGLASTFWIRDLTTKCAPETGSPDGIQAVLKLMDNIAAKISDLIGVSVTPTTSTSDGSAVSNELGSASPAASSGKPKKDTRKIIHYFSNSIFDSNQLKGTGFHYLKNWRELIRTLKNNNNFAGARVVKSADFQNRIDRETLKYFFEDRDASAVTDLHTGRGWSDNEAKDLLLNLNASKFSYLAPCLIRIGGGWRGSENRSVSLWDEHPYEPLLAVLASDIANIKSPPNSPKAINEIHGRNDTRATGFDRTIRDNLTEVLADKGCTIETPLRAPAAVRATTATQTERQRQVRGTGRSSIPGSPGGPARARGAPSRPSVSNTIKNLSGVVTKSDKIESLGEAKTSFKEVLGSATRAIEQVRKNRERIIDIHTNRDADVFNPGLTFLRIMMNFILEDENLVRKEQRQQGFVGVDRRYQIGNFNVRRGDNRLATIHRGGRNGDGEDVPYSSFIPQIPNQIKSLFLSNAHGGDQFARGAHWFEDGAILFDPLKMIKFFLRYMHLVRVEVLTEYDSSSQQVQTPMATSAGAHKLIDAPATKWRTNNMMKKPIWQPLTREIFQDSIDLGSEMLCRLIPYEDGELFVMPLKGLQLPIYDSYFLIKPPAKVQFSDSDAAREEESERRTVKNQENTLGDVKREYVSTDPQFF